MLLRGRIKYVVSGRKYMDSSRVHGHDLKSLVSPPLALISIVVTISLCLCSHTKYGLVILAVYIDDILLIGSNSTDLVETKKYLRCHFVTKNMGKPKYFLRIEVAHKEHSVLFSQRKYALLEKT